VETEVIGRISGRYGGKSQCAQCTKAKDKGTTDTLLFRQEGGKFVVGFPTTSLVTQRWNWDIGTTQESTSVGPLQACKSARKVRSPVPGKWPGWEGTNYCTPSWLRVLTGSSLSRPGESRWPW